MLLSLTAPLLPMTNLGGTHRESLWALAPVSRIFLLMPHYLPRFLPEADPPSLTAPWLKEFKPEACCKNIKKADTSERFRSLSPASIRSNNSSWHASPPSASGSRLTVSLTTAPATQPCSLLHRNALARATVPRPAWHFPVIFSWTPAHT